MISAPVQITPAVARYIARSVSSKPLGLLQQCGWTIMRDTKIWGLK